MLDIGRSRAKRPKGLSHTFALIPGRREHLPGFDSPIDGDRDQVGERPADVDADGITAHSRRRRTHAATTSATVARSEPVPTQSPSRTKRVVTDVVCT